MIRLTNENQLQALKFTEQKDPRIGLIGEWKLDGNLLDTSGNGNNGTFVGGVPNYVEGRVGKCVSFNGVNQYVDCGLGTSIVNNITISLWVKFNSATYNPARIYSEYLFVKNGNYGLAREVPSNKIRLYIRGTTYSVGLSGTKNTWNINQWYHIVGVVQGTTGYIYIDNVLDKQGPVDWTPVYTSKLSIGGLYAYMTETAFSGSIDEVRLYNRVLTTDEITTLYNTQRPKFTSQSEVITEEFDEVITDGLVAYYELNGNTKDSVGTNDGTAYGSPVYASGVKNKCMSFDGVNDYVDCGNKLPLTWTQFSFCAWVKTLSGGVLFVRENVLLYLYPNRFRHIQIGDGTTEATLWTPNNIWQHVCVGWTGQNTFVYNNGVFVGGEPATGTMSFTGNYNPTIGKVGTGHPGALSTFSGLIDDVRIYNRALSEQEIKHIYESTKP